MHTSHVVGIKFEYYAFSQDFQIKMGKTQVKLVQNFRSEDISKEFIDRFKAWISQKETTEAQIYFHLILFCAGAR